MDQQAFQSGRAAYMNGDYSTAATLLGAATNPGEVFAAPEAALVCSPSGFGQMSRQLHRAVRERLVRDPCQGGRSPW